MADTTHNFTRNTLTNDTIYTTATRGFWYRASRHVTAFPFILVTGLLFLLQGLIAVLHNEKTTLVPSVLFLFNNYQIFGNLTTLDVDFTFPIILVVIGMAGWGTQVLIEADSMRYSTIETTSLRQGFALFLLTEIVFFFGLFWSFFHLSLNPSIEIGAIWPPADISTWTLMGFPLSNTFFLLYSGSWATETTRRLNLTNHLTKAPSFIESIISLATHSVHIFYPSNAAIDRRITVTLTKDTAEFLSLRQIYATKALEYGAMIGTVFAFSQIIETLSAPLSLTIGGAFSSAIYFITNFHGFHVNMSGVMVMVLWFRMRRPLVIDLNTTGRTVAHTSTNHVYADATLWYWHFVDIIWIGILSVLYIWGA